MSRLLKLGLFGLMLLSCACSSVASDDLNNDPIAVTETPLNPTAINTIEAYPISNEELRVPDSSYPISAVPSYPSPRIIDESKRVTINAPLKVNVMEVSGIGPPNTPIKVISISHVGKVLGFGVIESNGTFNIQLEEPLELQNVIGIQLSNSEMESEFLDGPGFTSIPMIGLVLDQAVVED